MDIKNLTTQSPESQMITAKIPGEYYRFIKENNLSITKVVNAAIKELMELKEKGVA